LECGPIEPEGRGGNLPIRPGNVSGGRGTLSGGGLFPKLLGAEADHGRFIEA
jgi:hypothetical protein